MALTYTGLSQCAVPYGVPLDSQSDGSKTDFSLWMAGVYHDNSTMRDIFIEGVYDYLVFGSSGQAVPDYYSANNATQIGGFVNRCAGISGCKEGDTDLTNADNVLTFSALLQTGGRRHLCAPPL